MKKAMIVVLFLLLPGTAAAQQALLIAPDGADAAHQGTGRQWSFGVRGGVLNENATAATHTGPLVGFEVVIPIDSSRFFFNPNVEIAAADSASLSVNGDFGFLLLPPAEAKLWVGGGVGYLHRSYFLRSGEGGIVGNIFLGAEFGQRRVRPYAQGKVAFGRDAEVVVAFGVRF